MSTNNKISDSEILEILSQAKKDGAQQISVGAIIVKDSKILCLKRVENDFLGGYLDLPGGGVDKGEGVIEALSREVKEETNLDVISVEKYVSYFDYKSGSGKKTRQLSFYVIVKDSPIELNPKEHSAYYWLAVGDLELDK